MWCSPEDRECLGLQVTFVPRPNDERQSAPRRSEESEGRAFCRGEGVEGAGALAVRREQGASARKAAGALRGVTG